jgi:hypothetical protein
MPVVRTAYADIGAILSRLLVGGYSSVAKPFLYD